jgi:hypothetical protein
MLPPTHAGAVGQQFQELYRRLSRDQANALLNDCIYELSAAWRFLTSLTAPWPMLVVLHGFSGVPLAFARHLRRVDVLGLNQQEMALFEELATFKNLTNYRLLRQPEEMNGPYGAIVWLPAAVESQNNTRLLQAISHLHPQGELWLAHTHTSNWRGFLNRLKAIAAVLKSRNGRHEQQPSPIRLFPTLAPMPDQSHLNGVLAQLTSQMPAAKNVQPAAQRVDYLGIIPDWSSPTLLAPLPSSGRRNGAHAENAGAGSRLKTLTRKKGAEANHALARVGRQVSAPFFVRLLSHLEQSRIDGHIQPNRFRVLAGGKVQIDARWKKPEGEPAFFIKLPLVPFAEARLRKQSEMLAHLQSREMQRRIESQPMLQHVYRQRIFPQMLAQGEFEKQAYFVESRVKGMPLSRLRISKESLRKFCDVLFLFWHRMQLCCGKHVKIDDERFEQLFQAPLQRLAEWAQPPQRYQEIMQRLGDFFASRFAGKRISLSLVHGDFSTKNILAHPQNLELSGIIDWDMALKQSLPLLDVLHFFIRLDPGSFRESPPVIALRLIEPDARASHWPYFQAAMEKFDCGEGTLTAVVAYYWLQRLQVYLDSPKNLDAQFMQRHFYAILDLFEETVL